MEMGRTFSVILLLFWVGDLYVIAQSTDANVVTSLSSSSNVGETNGSQHNQTTDDGRKPVETNTGEPMIIYPKRCTTHTECNWGWECNKFQRVLEPNGQPKPVQNCQQCIPSCRADGDCSQSNEQTESNKCLHGCCRAASREKEYNQIPILRGIRLPNANSGMRRIPA